MKKLTFVVIVAVLVSFAYGQGVEDPFGNVAKREALKMKIDNMRAEIKAQGHTFTVDYNPAMQFPLEQLCNFRPELAPAKRIDDDAVKFLQGKPSKTPKPTPTPDGGGDSYIADYTSIKNQGNCGSCWAFSTAGMFESVLLKQGINVNLSEQWLVSCNTDGWGCNGGWFADSYYRNPGAVLENCFRYKANDIPCKDTCPYVYIATGSGSAGNVSGAQGAIQNWGGVSCAVTATSYMQAYSGGVFSYDTNASVNHAVVLVGWDDSLGSSGAWRMKNSWGSGWGEGGMMWIEYGASKIGYGGNYLKY
ncbi:MAG: hypothetical protein KAW12_04885 [Candidatus Aminicenantes bacterium]|nr:hypothetical protein [Candidatus Aminicenantes bacterium]